MFYILFIANPIFQIIRQTVIILFPTYYVAPNCSITDTLFKFTHAYYSSCNASIGGIRLILRAGI